MSATTGMSATGEVDQLRVNEERTMASSGPSILIVDDNPGQRLALKAILAPLGFRVVEADSGIAALRCVHEENFAVILLDVRMPIMDGVETASLIRRRQQSEMTPIIFITSQDNDETTRTNRYAQGAVDFISAPVIPHELRAKVSVFAGLYTRAEDLASKAREVQTTADQLRLLTDAAPVGIFQTDADNRYTYTNPRWSAITGMSSQEATGQVWDTIVDAEQRAAVASKSAGVSLDRAEISHRFQIRRPDRLARIVLVTSKPVPDGLGGVAGWVGTLADVTDEAGAEAALSDARDKANEASRLKSDFLANMSHEIRTPMNGVIGMTDLLLETDLDARQRDYAQTLRNSGEALLTIINDILDFSKVEAGQLEVEAIRFTIRSIVDDVMDLLTGTAQTKGLELMAVVDDGVPETVVGDPGRLRQVLINLLGNALKFTHAGEVVIRVTVEAETSDTGTDDGGDTASVRFEISDTGVGIAPDSLATIFQPFVQADTSTSRRYGGTGLGLAISGQLVALMGGRCGVTSQLGAGSTFWFTIQVGSEAGQATHESMSSRDGLAGVSALIVDDNAARRGVLSEYLTNWSMTVGTADSGRDALEALRRADTAGRPFSLMLMEASMTGMDGVAVRDAIDEDPALKTNVILMTDRGHDDAGRRSGSVPCPSVSKPVHLGDLLTSLRVALGLQEAEAAPDPVAPRRRATGFSPDPVAPAAPTPASSSFAPAGETELGRLLLAEDNLINQKVAVAMLAGAGYRVDTVLNGADAVQAVTAQSYDAILMDCQMPELNGYEATARIRALESPRRLTPIIAMTAGARHEDRQRCLAEGMDSYLAKPVSKDALLALVARSVKSGRTMNLPVPPDDGDEDDGVVIDERTFDELRLLGEAVERDFVGELVDAFIEATGPLLISLRTAIEIGDGPTVSGIAHDIRGSSVQLGGQHLAFLCSRLEDKAKAGALIGGGLALQQIESGYHDLCDALSRKISSSHPQPVGGIGV